jgi:hypothetical protein
MTTWGKIERSFMPAVSSRRSTAHPRSSTANISRRRRRHHSQRSGIWWLPLAIRTSLWLGVIALIGVVVTLLMNGGFDDPNPQSKTIQLTDQDIDPETTNQGKTFLHQNQVDQRLAFYLWAEAQQRLPADTLTEVRNALTHGAVTLAIGPLVKQMSDDLDQGRVAAYTLWFEPDDQHATGDVRLLLNGTQLGDFPVGSDRYAITFYARTGSVLHLQIAAAPDSRSPVVFRAATATSEAVTRKLAAGKTDSWDMLVQQTYEVHNP